MKILLHGIYPRSESLIQGTRDFDRNRINKKELEVLFKRDIENFKNLQKGFEYISTGNFYLQDLMRIFPEFVEGVRIGGLKRFYETNTFYRVIEFNNKFEIVQERVKYVIDKYFLCKDNFREEDPLLLTFPFIYFFKEFSENIDYPEIEDLILSLISGFKIKENKLIVFYEPSFGLKKITSEEKKIGVEFVEKLRREFGLKVFIFTFFFNPKEELEFLFSLPVDGIGFDFFKISFKDALSDFPKDKYLLAGVINTYSPIIYKGKDINIILDKIKGFKEDKFYVTTNAPPELLPRSIMDRKVEIWKKIL